ncbi:hypothetical protein ACKWTF_003763 [Chironomus riparius]
METLNSSSSDFVDQKSECSKEGCSITAKRLGCKVLNFLGIFSIFVLFVMTKIVVFIWWFLEKKLIEILQILAKVSKIPLFVKIIFIIFVLALFCNSRKMINKSH